MIALPAELRAGRFRLSERDVREWRTVAGMDPAVPGVPAPVALMIAYRSDCADLAEVMAALDADITVGGMMGELAITVFRPLRSGMDYAVRVSVTSVEAKQGRSGPFRVAEVVHTLVDDEGAAVRIGQRWILLAGPR
jgi:hypothetical protein